MHFKHGILILQFCDHTLGRGRLTQTLWYAMFSSPPPLASQLLPLGPVKDSGFTGQSSDWSPYSNTNLVSVPLAAESAVLAVRVKSWFGPTWAPVQQLRGWHPCWAWLTVPMSLCLPSKAGAYFTSSPKDALGSWTMNRREDRRELPQMSGWSTSCSSKQVRSRPVSQVQA